MALGSQQCSKAFLRSEPHLKVVGAGREKGAEAHYPPVEKLLNSEVFLGSYIMLIPMVAHSFAIASIDVFLEDGTRCSCQ